MCFRCGGNTGLYMLGSAFPKADVVERGQGNVAAEDVAVRKFPLWDGVIFLLLSRVFQPHLLRFPL